MPRRRDNSEKGGNGKSRHRKKGRKGPSYERVARQKEGIFLSPERCILGAPHLSCEKRRPVRRKRSQNGDLIPTEDLSRAVIKEMNGIHHPSRAETRAAINCMYMNVLGSPPPSS